MSNYNKDRILDFLTKHARRAPICECMTIACDFQVSQEEAFHMKEALALLSEVIGFDENGGFEDIARKHKDDKAICWALDQVSYCHAWVVCGPVEDGLNRLKEQITDDLDKKKRSFGVSSSYIRKFKTEVEQPKE